jgi:peptidoglycan-N-acetylmuramic acid deacetylase
MKRLILLLLIAVIPLSACVRAIPAFKPGSPGRSQPTGSQQTPNAPPRVHRVKPGDTLYGLAERYNTTVAELQRWNHLGSDEIQVGQLLQVSTPAAPEGPDGNPGDTAGNTQQGSNGQPPLAPSTGGGEDEWGSTPPRTPEPEPDYQALDNTLRGWSFQRNSKHQTVTVYAPADLMTRYQVIYGKVTDEKVVYLTFDEGYENGFTPEILDVLKENGVKAAFFVTGGFIDRNPSLVTRMVTEGHLVGNHSISHPSFPTISIEQMKAEVTGVATRFMELTGQPMRFFRFPKGEYSERSLAAVEYLGYRAVFWDMAHLDWDVNNQPGADKAYQHVMSNLHPGSVILLHAVSESNTEALDRILKGVKAEGYRFGSLEEFETPQQRAANRLADGVAVETRNDRRGPLKLSNSFQA